MIDINLSAAHLHLALNHIPIIGLAVSCLPIVIGILAQCRTTIATGLLATILCAAAMPTVIQTGEEAAHSFKIGVTMPPLDEAGKIALHIHSGRAKKTTPVIYASALLAMMSLLALIKFPKAATWLAATVILGNAFSIALSIWTADAGGRLRHLEFRPKTPWDEPTTAIILPPVAPPPSAVAIPIPTVTPIPLPTPASTPTLLSEPSSSPEVIPSSPNKD